MNIFEQLMAGVQDAFKPRNVAFLLAGLALVGFYVNSDLPGASQVRNFLP